MSDIEERIRPHVDALQNAGFKTTGSCGHDMWISIDAAAEDFLPLHATLVAMGYKDFRISYCISDWHHKGRFTVTFGGELEGDGKPFDLVLLKVVPSSHPLYFVLAYRRYPHHEARDDPDAADQYFFEEHTCPTNWTSDIIAVIADGDEDPHGFASFVRRRVPPDGMDKDGYIVGNGPHEQVMWRELFPEIDGD